MFTYEQFPELVGERMTACAWGVNRTDVFWNAGGRLGHRWFDTDLHWHTEVLDVGSPVTSPPASCSGGGGRMDVLWIGADGHLHHKWTVAGAWVAEETLPMMPSGVPTVAASRTGTVVQLDVFWIEPSGALHRASTNGPADSRTGFAWHEETVPADLAGDPAAVSRRFASLDVFARSRSGTLVHLWWDGAHWSTEDRGGTVEGAPAAGSWGPGAVDVIVRHSDNTLWHIWYDELTGGWHDWTQREGRGLAAPALTSWGDGRFDIFVAGTDGHLWHGWYSGLPIASNPRAIQTYWTFLRTYTGDDKARRVNISFASGVLNNGSCSGSMVSPHLFLTASHCGGPGTTGGVSFFAVDPDGAPDGSGQALSPRYNALTLPWQDSGISGAGHLGDSVLWWLPDGPDGVAPGIRYGYLDITDQRVPVGTAAYSFFQNAGLRQPVLLLYTDGAATDTHDDAGDWRGEITDYAMWSTPGCSGSTTLVADFDHAVVGVTQGETSPTGIGRAVVDARAFVARHDADANGVVDAIDYDWLLTRPVQPLYLETFDTRLQRAHWVAVPRGSGANAGVYGTVGGAPAMAVAGDEGQDGYWHHFARFKPDTTYRISVVATGSGVPGDPEGAATGYLRLLSDSTGASQGFTFPVNSTPTRLVGSVRTGPETDYRLLIGCGAQSTVQIASIALVEEGAALNFGTHDERRSWQYAGATLPTSWGPSGPGFGARIVGPTSTGWGISNRFLALDPTTTYRLDMTCKLIGGEPNGPFAAAVDLGGSGAAPAAFTLDTTHAAQQISVVLPPGPGGPKTLTLGSTTDCTYVVTDLLLTPM